MTQTIAAPFAPEPVSGAAKRDGAARDGDVYVYHNPNIALAVNVALVTKRPLLLTGPSGSGKSALARNIAKTLKHRFYEHVVTGRTEAGDLLYSFDTVRRLADAQSGMLTKLPPTAAYVEPGVLWWAISPDTAATRGAAKLTQQYVLNDPSGVRSAHAVVLIDEIDKADPDVPNGLLVPLGAYRFHVQQTNVEIQGKRAPLVVITNNGERELPATFVRRCVALRLDSPGQAELVQIAKATFPEAAWDLKLFDDLAARVIELTKGQDATAQQRWSTAEYLDAVRACRELGVKTDGTDTRYETLLKITLQKPQPSDV